jgi:glucosamine-6-phosphate deaminase
MTTQTIEPWVRIFSDPVATGRAAAADIAAELRRVISRQGAARVIFASAPSQAETINALLAEPDIDWSAVTAFHMDEYIGLDADDPAGFGNWIKKALWNRVPLGTAHVLDPSGGAAAEARRYADLLAEAPIDIVCLGIGVNGHIAFNDPPVADFDDPQAVKVVELDEICRQQQVDDECFDSFDDVPTRALTLSVPRLLDAGRLFCVVSKEGKAEAVRATLLDPLGEHCPSTILRTHPGCTLYLDADAASRLRAALGA